MAEIKKISTELQLLDKFLDTSGDAGTSGQILSSTATGINWIDAPSISGLVDGSGTANYSARWIDTDTLGIGVLYDNGTSVGIGTVTPGASYKLEVNGLVKADGGYFTNPVYIYDIDITENPRLSLGRTSGESLNFDVIDRDARIYHKQDETTGGHKLNLSVDSDTTDLKTIDFQFRSSAGVLSSTPMTLLSSGKVGIGTTTPRSELSVEYIDTHSSGDLSVENSGFDIYNTSETNVEGTGAALTFSDNYFGSSTYNVTTRAAIKGGKENAGNTANGFLAFYTDRGSSNSMSEKMRITSNGKVGIGTNIPNNLLTIEETDDEAILQINRNDDTIGINDRIGKIQFGAKGSWDLNLTVAKIESIAKETFTSTDNGTSLNFFTTELGSSTATHKMIIDTNGNVGIGDTTPSAKLTVRGTPSASPASEDLLHIEDGGGVRMMEVTNDAAGHASIQVKETTGITKTLLNSSGDSYFNGGNVGIGNANPTSLLYVSAPDGTMVDTAVAKIINEEETAGDNFGLYVQAGTNSSDISFRVADKDNSEYLRVRGDGNVGIGTLNPTENLHVGGDSRFEGDVIFEGKITHNDGIDFESWGREYHSVNVNAPTPLLTNDGSALETGGAYKVVGHIHNTGTDNVSVAVFWNQNGTWFVNKTFEGGTSSNHVEFKLLDHGSGVVPTVTLESHTANYTVNVQHERIALGEDNGTDNLRGYFGADSYLSWLDTTDTLTIPGKAKATSFIKDGGTSSQFLKADGSIDSSTYLTSASLSGFIDGSGSAGKLPKFTDSDTVEDSIITEDSSKIGIGVASPKAALHVSGAVIVGDDQTAASADLAGALRYWDENSAGIITSYVDMCMKHACGYQWVNIVTNRTACL